MRFRITVWWITRLGSLVVLALALLALSPSVEADQHVTEVRNGVYGKVRGDDYVYFRVNDRRVSKLSFNMRISCFNSDTGETYDRYFSARNLSGGRVNDRGRWSENFTVVSDFRTGEVNAEINFRRPRPLASFAVIVPGRGGSFESCDGFMALRAVRGG
jgi:hypothetical protein